MNLKHLGVCVWACVALCPATAWSQTPELPELVTDRPDFTESSRVVGRGLAQLELGTSLESKRLGVVTDRTVTTPLALLRLGLTPRLELRISGDGVVSDWTKTGNVGGRQTGGSDFELGVKYVLAHSEAFEAAIIPMVAIPSGSAGVTSGGYDPTVKFTAATSLPASFDLSGNINLTSLTDDQGRFGQKALSLSLGHDLIAGWGGYLETYSFTPNERGAGAAVTVDWGVSHGIGGNMQIDFEAGRGLTDAAPDWFIGVGFAIRGHVSGKRR